jgi:hypothetical protein
MHLKPDPGDWSPRAGFPGGLGQSLGDSALVPALLFQLHRMHPPPLTPVIWGHIGGLHPPILQHNNLEPVAKLTIGRIFSAIRFNFATGS